MKAEYNITLQRLPG
jgi:hypothetical protein